MRPDLVLQASSLDQLGDDNTYVTLPLVRQMTAERYKELETLNERAEVVSWILTGLEILGLFFASKAIA